MLIGPTTSDTKAQIGSYETNSLLTNKHETIMIDIAYGETTKNDQGDSISPRLLGGVSD